MIAILGSLLLSSAHQCGPFSFKSAGGTDLWVHAFVYVLPKYIQGVRAQRVPPQTKKEALGTRDLTSGRASKGRILIQVEMILQPAGCLDTCAVR